MGFVPIDPTPQQSPVTPRASNFVPLGQENQTPVSEPESRGAALWRAMQEAESQGIPLVKEKLKAALSGINAGLTSPLRLGYASTHIGHLLYPDLPLKEAKAKVEFRNLDAERKAPDTAGFMSGLGTLPYTMFGPTGAEGVGGTALHLGKQLFGGGLQGATSAALLDESKDPWEKAKHIGAGFGFGTAGAAFPKVAWSAEQGLEKLSARHFLKASGAASESEIQALRGAVGSRHGDIGLDAGRSARNLTVPGTETPGFFDAGLENRVITAGSSPKTNLERLGKIEDHYGPQIDEIAAKVDAAKRGAVDLDGLLARVEQEASGMNSAPDRAFNKGEAGAKARQLIDDFRKEIKQQNQVSSEIQYPEPMQGNLGVRPQELVPGPEVTLPPQRQIGNEVEIQQGMPLTRTTGPEAVATPTPEATRFTFDKPYVPPVGEPIQREMFGPPLSTAVEGAPVMVQDPAIAQSVARQGNFQNDPSFPPRDPVTETGRTYGMDLSEAIAFKRWLQRDVNKTANEKNPTRPQTAIDLDPDLQFKQSLSRIFKNEAERAVETHLPSEYSRFTKANSETHQAMNWYPMFMGAANRYALPGGGFQPSNLAGRRLLGGVVGAGLGGGIGHLSGGVPGASLGAAAGALASEGLIHAGERFGHPLMATMARDLQAKAGVLSNPTLPRLFSRTLAGMQAQEDPNAPSE